MKVITFILVLMVSITMAQKKKKGGYYNILSLDGGGIKGLIPAEALKKIETYAYTYCKEKGLKPPVYNDQQGNPREAVAMKDMFDMISGTSTGSIITAALSFYNKKDPRNKEGENKIPTFFADEIKNIYTENGSVIFADHKASGDGTQTLVFLIVVVFFGALFYMLGKHIYDNDETKKNFERIDQILSNQKRKLKGNDIKHDNDLGLAKSMKNFVGDMKDFNMMAVFSKNEDNENAANGIEMAENKIAGNENSVTPINN